LENENIFLLVWIWEMVVVIVMGINMGRYKRCTIKPLVRKRGAERIVIVMG
jgi:hypothetical protein